jgi:hypothetical protein
MSTKKLSLNDRLAAASRQSDVVKRIFSFKTPPDSLSRFARICGIRPKKLIDWDRGAMPDDSSLFAIAERLGTTVLYLKYEMGPRAVPDADRFWESMFDKLWPDRSAGNPVSQPANRSELPCDILSL